MLIDTTRSPHARLRPVPIRAVRLREGFWLDRLRRNAERSIPAGLQELERAGALENFAIAAAGGGGTARGPRFHDSDVYKWLEAASLVLASGEDPELERKVDSVVAAVAAAQEPDGYLNTHYTIHSEKRRFSNLASDHELYCAGHLIQAAIAHHRSTGKTALLDVAVRFADLLGDTFGPGRTAGAPGHPEIEMALVELYRETREARYLELASYFIDARGADPPLAGGRPYMQDHAPFRAQAEAVGHAVRAMYLYAGAADLYAERGDPTLLPVLRSLWFDVWLRKMYVTGGVGARHDGESFGEPYELPNATAYAETCAAIGFLAWAWRMLAADWIPVRVAGSEEQYGNRYADAMEIALYNGILAGVSLDGTRYFYVNPLESDGGHERRPWFSCACCPPNAMRTLAALPGMLFSVDDENGFYIHQYATADVRADVAGGPIRLSIRTDYPWEGEVRIRVEEAPSSDLTIRMRIPSWCPQASIRVNGGAVEPHPPLGYYASVAGRWKPGDEILLSLPMPVDLLVSHPRVRENRGCAALRRGPILYCFESVDLAGVDPAGLRLDLDAAALQESFRPVRRDDLLGGVVALEGRGRVFGERGVVPEPAPLYRPLVRDDLETRDVSLLAIPYHAWANRGPSSMRVWIPYA